MQSSECWRSWLRLGHSHAALAFCTLPQRSPRAPGAGLTKAQCERMTSRWHVYLTLDGRISMAGLSRSRVAYLAAAIKDCVTNA